MAAIAGVIHLKEMNTNTLVHQIIKTLCHRSDGSYEIHQHKNIEIAITGNQFGKNQMQTIIAGFDGTIENCAEICKDLQSHGYPCMTTNPNDILVHAYEIWGTTVFSRLEGSFSLVIFDVLKNKIIIARDRVGVKPLYWYHDKNHFIFASEIKALLATRMIPQTASLDALSAYLYFGFIPQDMSPIKDVNKLLPSYYLECCRDLTKTVNSYWSFSSYFENAIYESKNDIIKNLDLLIEKRMEKIIPKNEDFGCIISGGIGSAVMGQYLKNNSIKGQLTGYSVHFKGQSEEEFFHINEIIRQFNIPHVRETIKASDFLDNIVPIAWYLDEPISSPSATAIYRISQLASKKVGTLFTGTISDDILSTQSQYISSDTRNIHIKEIVYDYFVNFLISTAKFLYKPFGLNFLKHAHTHQQQLDYLNHKLLFNHYLIGQTAPKIQDYFNPEVFLNKFEHLSRISSNVGSYLYYDIKTQAPDFFNIQYERLLTVNHIQWQTPFTGRFVIEYLAQITNNKFVKDGGLEVIFKELIKDSFNKKFFTGISRPKNNFLKSWANESSLKDAFQTLEKGRLVEAGLISKEWLKNETSTEESRTNSFKYLWAVLSLEIWFRLFISSPIEQSPPNIGLLDLLNDQ